MEVLVLEIIRRMEITIKTNLSQTELYVKPLEKIDINTAIDFGEQVNDALDEYSELVIDLEAVDYISSMGLRVILELQKRMNQQGSMKLINVKPEIMDIFKITGFDKILTIE